jgi:NAD+ synthetase
MEADLNIEIAQLNFTVGDCEGNSKKILEFVRNSHNKTDLIIFSELAVSGYPPEDLLLNDAFIKLQDSKIQEIARLTKDSNKHILLGAVHKEKDKIYNAALLLAGGKIQSIVKKNILPNYAVFDEMRYFAAGDEVGIITIKSKKYAVLICEDLWDQEFINKLQAYQDLEAVFVLNASPYEITKLSRRIEIAKNVSSRIKAPVIYVNQIGGQDHLIFDGNSFVVNQDKLVRKLPSFEESSLRINLSDITKHKKSHKLATDKDREIYNALILSLRDYVQKSSFDSVLVAMSAGIDSTLCAMLAIDALGKDKVGFVTMPSQHTSYETFFDANEFFTRNKITNFNNININQIYDSVLAHLQDLFLGKEADITEENIQSRIRGLLIMALSNKFQKLVITTGNKSEVAVGYSTLYGDTCGAFSLIKDIYKTQVFSLAKWRNRNIPKLSIAKLVNPIPDNIINKEPTAELRDGQKDSDSLPDYQLLDKILYHLIEMRSTADSFSANAKEKKIAHKIAKLLNNSEYKRRQVAIGPKVSKLSFDRDRRFPIINKFSL